MSPLGLDPWRDAAELAARLARPDSRLVLVLAAEAWCRKCRRLRPVFEARAAGARPDETFLWLDLDAHAEFIGDYLPDDLPMLFVYRGERLDLQCVLSTPQRLAGALDSAPTAGPLPDPGLRRRLLAPTWALPAS